MSTISLLYNIFFGKNVRNKYYLTNLLYKISLGLNISYLGKITLSCITELLKSILESKISTCTVVQFHFQYISMDLKIINTNDFERKVT